MQTQTIAITVTGESPVSLDVTCVQAPASLTSMNSTHPVRCEDEYHATVMATGHVARLLGDAFLRAGEGNCDAISLTVFGHDIDVMDVDTWPAAVDKTIAAEFPLAGKAAS